jgi:indolepyruvate ferredoxin oxidoreductase beta subunit
MQANFKCYTLDAAQIAEELGNAKCMNIVLFGALTHALGMEDIDWEEIIRETVPPKFLELNLKAYRAGRAAAAK